MTAEALESDQLLDLTRDVALEYALLVEQALNARKAMDIGRWLLGDYVRRLITDFSKYRECTIEKFADAVTIDAKRLYEYASMASFYSLEKREELAELHLSYTHYREARRLRTIEKAVEFLKAIALNRWTIQQTRDALKALNQMGHKIADTFSDSPPMMDYHQTPVYPGARNVWQGIGTIKVGKQGFMLQCDIPPDHIDPDKRYEITVREILED